MNIRIVLLDLLQSRVFILSCYKSYESHGEKIVPRSRIKPFGEDDDI